MSRTDHSTTIRPDGKPAPPLDNNGRLAIYDGDGFRVPLTEIADDDYFPSPSIFKPTAEEAEEAALILAHAAVGRVLRAARGVIDAAMGDFDFGCRIPAATNDAIFHLDNALMALESMATISPPEDEVVAWAERLARFNADRDDEPREWAIDRDRDIMDGGLPCG